MLITKTRQCDTMVQWDPPLKLHCAADKTCTQVLNVNNIKANPLLHESPYIKCFLFILFNVATVSAHSTVQ